MTDDSDDSADSDDEQEMIGVGINDEESISDDTQSTDGNNGSDEANGSGNEDVDGNEQAGEDTDGQNNQTEEQQPHRAVITVENWYQAFTDDDIQGVQDRLHEQYIWGGFDDEEIEVITWRDVSVQLVEEDLSDVEIRNRLFRAPDDVEEAIIDAAEDSETALVQVEGTEIEIDEGRGDGDGTQRTREHILITTGGRWEIIR